jgi:hypothetical protein
MPQPVSLVARLAPAVGALFSPVIDHIPLA